MPNTVSRTSRAWRIINNEIMYLLLESPCGLNCSNDMSVTDQGTMQLSFEAGQAAKPNPCVSVGRSMDILLPFCCHVGL